MTPPNPPTGIRSSKPQISATDAIDVTFGAFSIGEFRVPFMSAVLRLQQVSEYLKLVVEDPKYARQNWLVTELFQREVNQTRVYNIARDYLDPQNAKKPPFFNSLTVVLNYGDNGEAFTPPETAATSAFPNQLKVGPILLTFERNAPHQAYPDAGCFGTLKWNRDQVYAVAIDGQHRLAALKDLYKRNAGLGSQTYVSVLFLIVDERVGFHAKAPQQTRVQLMRSIFIDLNKHAEPVSRARQLLLDDNDPTSRFVRELFSPCLEYKPTTTIGPLGFHVGQYGEFLERLPLDLVDWHSEAKSKVDEGPYLTSILGLDWFIRKAILSDSLRRRDEPKLIDLSLLSPDDEDYYDDVERQLKLWKRSWKDSIESDWKDSKDRGAPFILNQKHLEALCIEFRSIWGRPLTRLFSSIAPYRTLAKLRVEGKTISPQFGQWYQAVAVAEENQKQPVQIREHYQNRKEAVETELAAHGCSIPSFRNVVNEINARIKLNSVFFLIVTQRALVLALSNLIGSRKAADWSEWAKVDLKPFQECMHDFYAFYLVEAVNALHSAGAKRNPFEKKAQVKRKASNALLNRIVSWFWAGSILDRLDPDRVDFGEAGAKRTSKWFVLMAHLHWFLKTNPDLKQGTKLIDLLDHPNDLCNFHFGGQLLEAYEDLKDPTANAGPMAFLVAPLDTPEQRDEAFPLVAKERVAFLVECLKD